MKPRIRKINGLWHCAFLIVGRVGFGYTPKQAYDDWQSMRTINAQEMRA